LSITLLRNDNFADRRCVALSDFARVGFPETQDRAMTEEAVDYTRYYRHWHDGSDADYNSMVDRWTGILAPLVQVPLDARIVDIGCGTGLPSARCLNSVTPM